MLNAGACSNSTSGIFGGGYNPSPTSNTNRFYNDCNTGNAQDFGDLTVARRAWVAHLHQLVQYFGGGGHQLLRTDAIDYI